MFTKFLDPKNDFAFKRIFGSEKNKDILIALLNEVLANQLQGKIQAVTFLNPVQDPEVAAKKQSVVDVLCQDEYGTRYIIEMQVASTKGFEERAQYYACKAFVSQMKKGDPYEGLSKVIFIAFTNFNVFPGKSAYKCEHCVLDKHTLENDLDKLSFTFIDLPKFHEGFLKKGGPLERLSQEEKFYYFLYHAPETEPDELERVIQNAPIIAKAYKELDRCFWTEVEMQLYEREEKRLKDYVSSMAFAEEKGLQKGLRKGLHQGLAKAARGMAAAGLETPFIAKSLGLRTDAVEQMLRLPD